MRLKFLGLLLIFFSLPSLANIGDMPKEQQLAIKYIQALTHQDYANLSGFYNRESIFNDRTAGRKYTGKRHILQFLKRAHRGVLEYNFNIEHMFNSGSLVVLIGNYRYKGPGELFGKPGRIIDIAIPGVTTLSLDMTHERVKEHQDLMDYQTMADQLSVQ
ncbi:nuclear transport factor 2 family protein [Shewanella sp. 10N.261.52.F9]|uniref:nuclear transport factor 2 family protein n=1 Tax=Shewanella TaxID=22 RepID=UPI00200C516D|nr:nuclear transport factor 2 family protein [Shewanella marinintestina]MCL1144962.1 nuclear transport factor 2 family protein [Shewanella marinintestina]